MKYEQELENIKQEITNSGEKLEALAKSLQGLSVLTQLSETLNNFLENDENALQRIESKMDIICNAFPDGSDIEFIKNKVIELGDETNIELIKSKINHLSSKLNEYVEGYRVNVGENSGNVPSGLSGSENIQGAFNAVLKKLENNSDFYNSSAENINFLKENFYRINEKFTEVNLLIKTITGESEELNNRFESNLTHFNSCFNNIYKQFNDLDNTFNNNFKDFKACIQDVYDQFSSIDSRNDFDQIKLYVQSFSNKINSIAEDLEYLRKAGLVDNLKKVIEIEQKIDILANFDPTEIVNIFIESSKRAISDINDLKNSIEKNFLSKNEAIKNEIQEVQNKIEFLNINICSLLDKFDNDVYEIRATNSKILDEFKGIKSEFSSEISSLSIPLSSAIEISSELNESIKEMLSRDVVKVQQESIKFLDRFENIYRTSGNNFENMISSSKQFYEKLEEVKNDFSNISYDTNSKMQDFISKTENIDLKIQSSLMNSESAVNILKNVSEFAENQININSENLNSIKVSIKNLYEEFDSFKTDIVETGSKLNKIILNDKEKKASLSDEFKNIIKKIDKNIEIASENTQTTEDVKKAITYMADWFDTASGLIEDVNQNIKQNSVERVDSFIIRTEENITEQIKRISDRLNRFEVRLESIEGKIEKIEVPQNNREVMHILSDILEKIDITNERSRSNELILHKIESLEKKLKTLEKQEAKKV